MQWLVNGQVYDVAEGAFRRRAVALRDGRIEALAESAAPDAGDEVLDMAGAWVLPGLIDCHVHLTLNTDAIMPSAYAERSHRQVRESTLAAARATLLGGVTTVRDCGGWGYIEMDVRDEVLAGRALGPRMVLSGKLIWVDTPGAGDYPDSCALAKTPDELRAAAASQLEHGADFIKVMATGMTLSPEGESAHDCFYSADEVRALVDYAHGRGVKVACHAEGLDGIRAVVEAGSDSVEHGTYADDDILAAMAARGTFLVPTCMAMAVYLDDPALRAAAPGYIVERFATARPTHNRAMNNAYRHGVPIAMGTDAGAPGVTHGANAEEVGRMVRDAGMSAEDAILAATLNAARLLGLEDEIGSLEPGKQADLIAVRDNPLEAPETLERVAFVMQGGAVVRDELAPA